MISLLRAPPNPPYCWRNECLSSLNLGIQNIWALSLSRLDDRFAWNVVKLWPAIKTMKVSFVIAGFRCRWFVCLSLLVIEDRSYVWGYATPIYEVVANTLSHIKMTLPCKIFPRASRVTFGGNDDLSFDEVGAWGLSKLRCSYDRWRIPYQFGISRWHCCSYVWECTRSAAGLEPKLFPPFVWRM